MAPTQLDHPGIRWVPGYGPRQVVGGCPHLSCRHTLQHVVAHGPDLAHHELVQCAVPGGCEGNCRGWVDETPTTTPAHIREFLQVVP